MSVATFTCPHCAAVYPFKPVLVGRAVRCKQCQNAFSLRADGVADPVTLAPAPAVAPAPVPAAVPSRPPVPPPSAPGEAPSEKPSARLTKGQQSTRDEMAATLRASMSAALTTEAAKEPAKKEETTKRVKAGGGTPSSKRIPAKGPDGKAQLGPAVLTGEGEREARISRQWTLSILAVLVLGGGALFWFSRDNAREAAITAYTAVEENPRNAQYGIRLERIQQRALLVRGACDTGATAAFVDLPDLRFGAVQKIPGTQLGDLAAKLPATTDRKAAIRLAEDVGLGDDAGLVALHLLLGETAPGRNEIRERLKSGVPGQVEWCVFSGQQGSHLMDKGGRYAIVDKPYRGFLVRFLGNGWDAPWRVLTMGPDRRD